MKKSNKKGQEFKRMAEMYENLQKLVKKGSNKW